MQASANTNIAQHTCQWKQVLTPILHNTVANAIQASANSNIAQHTCQYKQVLTAISQNTLANAG